jgi:PAS domain S-box-containing protein
LRNLGIHQRVLLIALVPMAVVALALTLYFTLLRYGDVEEALVQRGAALARQLAPAAEYGMFSGNLAELNRLAQACTRESDVAAVIFFDGRGVFLASAGKVRNTVDPVSTPNGWVGHSEDGSTLYFHAKVGRAARDFDDAYADPRAGSGAVLQLGSLTVEMTRDRLVQRKREMFVFTLLSMAALMLGAALIARRLGRSLTEPIVALREAVNRIREGQLATRVAIHPAQTLRALEEGVNAMAEVLELAHNRSAAALASSEAALRKQYDFADALLQAQSDAGIGVAIIEGTRLVYVNDAVVAIHGYSRNEMLAMDEFSQHTVEQDISRLYALLENSHRAGWAGERAEVTIARKDGERRLLDVVLMPMRGESEFPRLVAVILDVTQRRFDAQRLAEANIELQRQRDEAERANRAKSRFLAAASHDLRQPLHALSLFGAEMEMRVTTLDQRRVAGQINTAVGALSELLDAMLDVSRLDIAALEPQLQPLALGPLLETAIQGQRCSAEAKRVKLSLRPTQLWACSDPQYLTRIVGNLVANAVRYTHSGGVLVGVRRAQESVRIEVWDSGIGISEQHLPHIFEEFYQVANAERDTAKGLGLGLSIVDRLASLLGHPIAVRSRPGQGSVFSVTLPRAEPGASDEQLAEPSPGGRFDVPLLLISAAGPERSSLAALLRGWGCRVAEAGSAEDIAEALESAQPALVICDEAFCLECQGSGGLDALSDAVPVVALGELPTRCAPPRQQRLSRLAKPVRPARLRALLQHLLDGAAD